ncbi:DNA repair protein RadC [Desulfitispora alkaliphila]|uniref:RadC family protein n=1 Tax=Desulfitispora alkaliphila TaxID=622674 RepID=UPI003D237A92
MDETREVQYHLIKELPLADRPRERLVKYGAETLTNSELLAILLRTGTKDQSVLSLAYKVLHTSDVSDVSGLRGLVTKSIQDLSEIKGIGVAKATQLKAAIELGRRISATVPEKRPAIKSPADVAMLLMEEMRYLEKEHFKTLLLNTKNEVLVVDTVSIGSLNASIVHPREVFQNPIKRSAKSIILVHNHPSGDPEPSSEDIAVSKRLIEAGRLLGIDVLDHIVIGDNKFISLKERGLI